MIEIKLIDAGLGCGSVKNFNTEILKNMKFGQPPKWYFKTPVKTSGHGLRTATLDMAFPFLAMQNEVDENQAIKRIEAVRKEYENDLISFFRSHRFIVPPDTANFSVIPFWATETGERNERKDFAQLRIHIIGATLTIKYRESWFN